MVSSSDADDAGPGTIPDSDLPMKGVGWFTGLDTLTTFMLPISVTYLCMFFVYEDAPVKMLAALQVDGEQWYADQRAPYEHSFTMILGFLTAYLLCKKKTTTGDVEESQNRSNVETRDKELQAKVKELQETMARAKDMVEAHEKNAERKWQSRVSGINTLLRETQSDLQIQQALVAELQRKLAMSVRGLENFAKVATDSSIASQAEELIEQIMDASPSEESSLQDDKPGQAKN